MNVTVTIKPHLVGRLSEHRIVVAAHIDRPENPVSIVVTAARLIDNVERTMNVYIEEAFVDILKQALS